MSFLSVKNLSYKYSQNNNFAVDDVSFEIEKGSYTAIVGLNGSGKSTLARMLCGLLDGGDAIAWEGNPRIGIVFQAPKDQIVSGIVYRDTEFGPLNLHLPPDEVELRTIESLNIVDMLDRADSSTSELSLGQTQKIALAGIIALRPDVLIMDEAVAMLDPYSRQDIFEFLRYWHKCGNSIIHITHDMEAVLEADNIIGMEKGKIYFCGKKDEFISNPENVFRVEGKKLPVVNKRLLNNFGKKEVALSVEKLNFNYNKKSGVKKISFNLYKGSITALTGPSGAGKSTILELCAGLLRAESGKIISGEKSLRPVLAQQNSQAALFETFAADDVAFGPSNRGIAGKELVELVKKNMNLASLPFEEFADRRTFELSGGEQRRLSIAGILAMDSDVILFDEPTAGLDCQARYNILMMMKQLASEGKTVLFSTHKKDEADFADREIRIEHGQIVSDTFEETFAVAGEEVIEPYSGIKMLESLRRTSTTLSGTNHYEKSIITRIPSWLRILIFLLLFITAICGKSILFCTMMFVIMLAYCKLAGFSYKSLLRGYLKILPFLLIFSILQYIFRRDILFCAVSLLRTFAAIGFISGFFISTPEYDLIDGLKILLKPLEVIKIPVRYFILIMEIVFRFIPLLIDETVCIIKTQLIRGGLGKAKGRISRIKAVIPLIVPMIIQTIKRSEALADAITVRCFK